MRRLGWIFVALGCTGCGDDGAGGDSGSGTAGSSASSSPSASSPSDSSGTVGSATSEGPTSATATGSSEGSVSSSATSSTETGPINPGDGGSLEFYVNAPEGDDYAEILELPPSFGVGELTFELWARPDETLPVGDTTGNDPINWTESDVEPHSDPTWWFDGNFLLDGHHNGGWDDGSFDLQLYGGGRVRWLFGDGELRGIQAYPATNAESILDGDWHHIACVRRADGAGAQLELWVDGVLIATEPRPSMVDMRQYWDTWSGFAQPGWMLGAEKGSAYGSNFVEDYKGGIAELRFWSRARTADELSTQWDQPLAGDEANLVGWFQFPEGAGATSCDAAAPARCFDLYPTTAGNIWSTDVPL